MSFSVSVLLYRVKRGIEKLVYDPRQWFVLTGDRLVVAGCLTGLFSFGVLALQYVGIVGVTKTTQMLYLFQGIVGGNLTMVTIVVSINQLVLSRELKTPQELRHQIQGVIEYRDRVEETTQRTAVPSTPADFLSVLIDGVRIRSQRLGGVVHEHDHDRLRAEVDALVTDVTSHTAHIADVLDDSQEGIFSALAVTLQTNYSHQINEAQRIQNAYGDDLSDSAREVFDEFTESLQEIDIARQYFKSIYMQSELARLSRILLYVGTVAVGGGLLLLLIYASNVEPPGSLKLLRVAVPVVVVAGFAPLAILLSFILRIATVAQRTVAITPFTVPAQEEADNMRGE